MLYNVKNIQEIVDDLTAKTIQNKKTYICIRMLALRILMAVIRNIDRRLDVNVQSDLKVGKI